MSVRWIIDELRRPVLLHAQVTLALYQHQRSSLRHVGDVARAQSGFWNALRVETRLPDGRDAELRFTVQLRPMVDQERAVFDSLIFVTRYPKRIGR